MQRSCRVHDLHLEQRRVTQAPRHRNRAGHVSTSSDGPETSMPREVLVKSNLTLEESRYSRVLDEGRHPASTPKTKPVVGYQSTLYTCIQLQ